MPRKFQKIDSSDVMNILALASPSLDAYAAHDAMLDALSSLKAAYLRRLLYTHDEQLCAQYEVRISQLEQMHRNVDLANVKEMLGVARDAVQELASIGGLGGGEAR